MSRPPTVQPDTQPSPPRLDRRLSNWTTDDVFEWLSTLQLAPASLQALRTHRPTGSSIAEALKLCRIKAADQHKIRRALKAVHRQRIARLKRFNSIRPWEPGFDEEKSQGCFPLCIITPRSRGKNKVGVVFEKRCMLHMSTTDDELYPEKPDRIKVINDYLKTAALNEDWVRIPARKATKAEISLVHSKEHVERLWSMDKSIASLAESKKDDKQLRFASDVLYTAGSFESILLSCGGVLEAVDKVVGGELDSCATILRPPGHHAERCKCMGFCFVNNVGVAAAYAKKKHGLKRIAIFDWDVHWGNATQKMFYEDPNVFYVSIHRFDKGKFYPGEKEASERFIGKGKGAGMNMNFPLFESMGDGHYMAIMDLFIEQVLQDYDPELIFISAGFDSAHGDTVGAMHVTEPCYAYMVEKLKSVCPRIVMLLEGGYNLKVLPRCFYASAIALLNIKPRYHTRDEYAKEGKSIRGKRQKVAAGRDAIVFNRLMRLRDAMQQHYPSLRRASREVFVEELYALWPWQKNHEPIELFYEPGSPKKRQSQLMLSKLLLPASGGPATGQQTSKEEGGGRERDENTDPDSEAPSQPDSEAKPESVTGSEAKDPQNTKDTLQPETAETGQARTPVVLHDFSEEALSPRPNKFTFSLSSLGDEVAVEK